MARPHGRVRRRGRCGRGACWSASPAHVASLARPVRDEGIRPLARLSKRPRSAVAAVYPWPRPAVRLIHRRGAPKPEEFLDLAQAARDVSVDTAPSSLLAPLKPVTLPLLPLAVAATSEPPATPEGHHSAIEPPRRMPHHVGEQVRHWLPDRPAVHWVTPNGREREERSVRMAARYMPSCMHVSPSRVGSARPPGSPEVRACLLIEISHMPRDTYEDSLQSVEVPG